MAVRITDRVRTRMAVNAVFSAPWLNRPKYTRMAATGPEQRPGAPLPQRKATAIAVIVPALIAAIAVPAAGSTMPASMPTVQPSAPIAGAGGVPAPMPTGRILRGRTALASAYDAAGESAGCPRSPAPQSTHLSVATQLVPCGARIRICTTKGRCVVAVRRDTGPFTGGREFDLNLGVVRALGVPSVYAWGVRRVVWQKVTSPSRAIASSGARTPR